MGNIVVSVKAFKNKQIQHIKKQIEGYTCLFQVYPFQVILKGFVNNSRKLQFVIIKMICYNQVNVYIRKGRYNMGVTIKDVAAKANTSVATVSRVINDSGYVSPELKSKVQQAITELNYRPNAVAKSLKNEKTNMIGLLISDITNPFFSSVVKAIEDTLNKKGYTVILCNTGEDSRKEKKYLKELLDRQIDGFIVSAVSNNGDHFQQILKQGLPLVFVNRVPDNVHTDNVILTDNKKGGYLAAKHLIDLGHSRIGAIVGPGSLNTGRDRRNGYERALKEKGIDVNKKLIKVGDFSRESGYYLIKELIHMGQPPTAVFVANNEMTLGAIEALKKLSIRIPEELSLVGFDYSEWMMVVEPKLTSIVQQSYQLGKESARRLLDIIKTGEKEYSKSRKILPPEFLAGNSSKYYKEK